MQSPTGRGKSMNPRGSGQETLHVARLDIVDHVLALVSMSSHSDTGGTIFVKYVVIRDALRPRMHSMSHRLLNVMSRDAAYHVSLHCS